MRISCQPFWAPLVNPIARTGCNKSEPVSGRIVFQTWQTLSVLCYHSLGIHMIDMGELPVTPPACHCHRAEDQQVKVFNRRSCIDKIIALLNFDLKAILGNGLLWHFFDHAGRVLENGPEIGYSKDNICTVECSQQTLLVVEVGLHNFNTSALPSVGFFRKRIARDSTDFPSW